MRILGITIPENKRLEIGLTAIFGIGRSRAQKILDEAKVDYGARPKDVSAAHENNIKKVIVNIVQIFIE
jgi:small subunit ribosomal protein S13